MIPSGKNSEGDDDEGIMIDLEKVDSRFEGILFVVTIEDYERRKYNFCKGEKFLHLCC